MDRLDRAPQKGAVLLADPEWHQGVVGIVASRLTEKYACPAFMVCLDHGMGKGSCRSWGGVNLFERLAESSDLLESFGGHALAAGFTVREENIPLSRRLREGLERALGGGIPSRPGGRRRGGGPGAHCGGGGRSGPAGALRHWQPRPVLVLAGGPDPVHVPGGPGAAPEAAAGGRGPRWTPFFSADGAELGWPPAAGWMWPFIPQINENLRKMLMAMAKDIRVILIKICDRLHNMRTMEYQSPKKQREKSLETMEIYAPIAHRLGMQKIKWELEDLSLRYLDPVGYKEIEDEMSERSSAHEEFLAAVQLRIQQRLEQEGIHCTVYGRVKHIYSIYRKMYAQNKTLDEIFDLYAFRVIVDDMPDCYNVLGCIHDMFKPVLGRFKDYIGTPKPNGYQSLHTTVIGREGVPFEVQIRTWDMHHTAEYGVAAHWKYKQGLANDKLGTEHAFEWVRKLLESQQDTDPDEFVRTLKVDLFADEVFVFTPSGDVKSLPAGATPIDFAYNIHSAVGNHMTGARVNGRMVTYDTPLHNGEIVEVLTSKAAKGPSRDWLKIAKSNEARNKIRQWFKKERREENIATGRASFEAELKHVPRSPWPPSRPRRCCPTSCGRCASAPWTSCTPPSVTAAPPPSKRWPGSGTRCCGWAASRRRRRPPPPRPPPRA